MRESAIVERILFYIYVRGKRRNDMAKKISSSFNTWISFFCAKMWFSSLALYVNFIYSFFWNICTSSNPHLTSYLACLMIITIPAGKFKITIWTKLNDNDDDDTEKEIFANAHLRSRRELCEWERERVKVHWHLKCHCRQKNTRIRWYSGLHLNNDQPTLARSLVQMSHFTCINAKATKVK